MKRQQKIEFYYPGSFVSETETQDIGHRDPKLAVFGGAYAFRFFDLVTLDGTLEDGSAISKSHRENVSKTYYPNGVVMDVLAVESTVHNPSILASNMRCNNWKYVVKTRRGNFQPFDPEKDELC